MRVYIVSKGGHMLTRSPPSYRAINGILAMDEFKAQFGTNCSGSGSDMDICPQDSSIIVSILSIGTIFGSLLAAPGGDFFGRRKTLVLSMFVFCIGAILQICATSTPVLLVGR